MKMNGISSTLARLAFLGHILACCSPTRAQHEGDVRLMIGNDESLAEGNVQYFHHGRWGSVCDDEWDKAEADVVCRHVGYQDGAVTATTRSKYGPGRDLIWIDGTYCTGSETSLSKCQFDGFGKHDCDVNEAAGVVCQRPIPRNRKPINTALGRGMTLRISGSESNYQGRIEVELGDGRWSFICADGWGIEEADTVCRQMGYGNAKEVLDVQIIDGRLTDIVLSGVKCRGTEDSLDQCLYEQIGIGRIDCPGSRVRVAGVSCTVYLPDLALNVGMLRRSAFVHTQTTASLQCAKEENCLSSSAYTSSTVAATPINNLILRRYRRLLRFTAAIFNNGTADFRSHMPKDKWSWHQCHKHYHSMEVFAHYDLTSHTTGKRVAEGHKASFCLEDNECSAGYRPKYVCADGHQGISVGCSDVYSWDVDCQWIDVTDLTTGTYVLRVSVNPEYKVAELSYSNNAVSCTFDYDGRLGATSPFRDCRLHSSVFN